MAGSKKRVLVIEDDRDIREALAAILLGEGYDAGQASNGAEALALLSRDPLPDVILLDLTMPVMDGWKFREEQRKDPRLSEIPVMVLSADGRVADKAARLQASAHMSKPIELTAFLAMVERLCA